ncbi:MAG: hypothetical protein MAG451_00983 [Anaerolineales bacterium]|nr:hypothetical protein [Anaerolineales bacterium]
MRDIPSAQNAKCWLAPLITVLFAYLSASPVYTDPAVDPRFGVVQAYEAAGVADEVEVGWERLFFSWPDMQPEAPDQQHSGPVEGWDEVYFGDAVINQEVAAGRELVGLLISTPAWASDGTPLISVPRGLYLPYDDAGNTWGQFVAGMAQRYAGRVDRWIVWNEPDIWDLGHPASTWEGTVEDYYRLVQVAYLAAKDANPDAKIHLGAFTYWWDVNYGRRPYLLRFLDVVAADPTGPANNYYFDVATVHAYFRPEQVYDLVQFTRRAMLDRGIDKPVWVNETNAPPSDDPANPVEGPLFPVMLQEQPAFLVQAFAMAFAAGAERVSVYKMYDEEELFSGEPYGLVRRDFSRRPALQAFDTITDHFAGFTTATLRRSGPVNVVRVERSVGDTTVLWNRSDRDLLIQIPATTAGIRVVDALNQRHVAQPVNRAYILRLPGTICDHDDCFIGGPPRLVIQEERASEAPLAVLPAQFDPWAGPDHQPFPR